MENLKYTYGQVNEWIKIADQKALILGSFNVVGLLYQLIKFEKVKDGGVYSVALSVISMVLTIVAMFFWLRIIYPKLDNKLKKSKIYFQHIANAYGEDMDSGINALQNFAEEDFKRDLASQIVINSVIAKKKYSNIQKFIWIFGAQLIALGLLFLSLL